MNKMIVYEDDVLLVVHKPAGMATQTARIGQADIVSELKNYRSKKGEEPYIGVVHRLDQPVEGLLAFAKTADVAKKLCAGLNGKGSETLIKKYAALISGVPLSKDGELTDYLIKDGRTNLSRVVPKGTEGAKEARLYWRLLKAKSDSTTAYALVEIELYTGRHHQIRVQMANAGFPLLGDSKYGSNESKALSREIAVHNTALFAHKLSLMHPVTAKRMEFSMDINEFIRIF